MKKQSNQNEPSAPITDNKDANTVNIGDGGNANNGRLLQEGAVENANNEPEIININEETAEQDSKQR